MIRDIPPKHWIAVSLITIVALLVLAVGAYVAMPYMNDSEPMPDPQASISTDCSQNVTISAQANQRDVRGEFAIIYPDARDGSHSDNLGIERIQHHMERRHGIEPGDRVLVVYTDRYYSKIVADETVCPNYE